MKFLSIVVVIALIGCVAAARTVTGNIRNEFQGALTLGALSLTSGMWVAKPPQNVDVSFSYGPLFVATGDNIQGWIHYTSDGGYADVMITFNSTPTNSTYNIKVGPSPFIGGVGTVTGTTDSVVPYWTHEMCASRIFGACINYD